MKSLTGHRAYKEASDDLLTWFEDYWQRSLKNPVEGRGFIENRISEIQRERRIREGAAQ